MTLVGLKVDIEALGKMVDEAIVETRTESGSSRVVTILALESTKGFNPTCKCEDVAHMAGKRPHVRGHLHAGMPISELRDLGAGCTTGTGFNQGWVCSRLDLVRRRCGL